MRSYPQTTVFARKAHYQDFHCGFLQRSARIGAMSGTIKLVGNEPLVPSQDGVRFRRTSNLFQRLPPAPLPISANVDLSASDSRKRVGRCALRMRFSDARYSFWSNNS